MVRQTRRALLGMGVPLVVGGLAGCVELNDPQATDTGTTTAGTASPDDPGDASLEEQLAVVRQASAAYARADGLETALEDGFHPTGPYFEDPQHLWVIESRRGPRRSELDLEAFNSLLYIRSDLDDPFQLGAVGYAIHIDDHGAAGHTPPDLFNDEGEDLQLSEAEGWDQFNPDQHPDPEDHTGFRTVFSDHDDTVRETILDLPHDVLFDVHNWRYVPVDVWAERGGLEPGDTYDVDGDGEPEVLDYTFDLRGGPWGLTVWVHTDNPGGLFRGRFVPDSQTPTPVEDIAEAPLETQLQYLRKRSEKYAGEGGIENAFADFRPGGIHMRDPELWFFFEDRTGLRREEVTLENFNTLFYLRTDPSAPLRLGGVGYSLDLADHGADGHTPPDLFNDEGEDLPVTEREGWDWFNPDEHPDAKDHREGAFTAVFSDYDGAADQERPPVDEMLVPERWGFISSEEFQAAEGYDTGDTYDVDGDGSEEVIDYLYNSAGGPWALAVWVHMDNPHGVFAGTPPGSG